LQFSTFRPENHTESPKFPADFPDSREVFLDLASIVGAFIDGYADLAARRIERAREEAGKLAFDIEEPNLLEIEEIGIEAEPSVHGAGRFTVKIVPNRYYLFAALPPVLGAPTEPVEITVPPEGTTIELRVHKLDY
jgi:hypothetical protein